MAAEPSPAWFWGAAIIEAGRCAGCGLQAWLLCCVHWGPATANHAGLQTNRARCSRLSRARLAGEKTKGGSRIGPKRAGAQADKVPRLDVSMGDRERADAGAARGCEVARNTTASRSTE